MNIPDESDAMAILRRIALAMMLVGGIILGSAAMRACDEAKQVIRAATP